MVLINSSLHFVHRLKTIASRVSLEIELLKQSFKCTDVERTVIDDQYFCQLMVCINLFLALIFWIRISCSFNIADMLVLVSLQS